MKRNKVRLLAAALGAALVIGGTGLPAMSVLAATATVVDTCNVRQDSTQSSEIVTQASGGSTVTIGDAVTNDAGETWYPVTLENGTTGYIKSSLLNVSAADTADGTDAADGAEASDGTDAAASADVPTAQGEGYAQAMTPTNATVNDEVNIRSGAGTDYTKIGTLPGGTDLIVIGQAKDSAGDIWYQFYTTGGSQQMIGFIRYDYLTLGDAAAVDMAAGDAVVDAAPEESAEKPDYEAVYTTDDTGSEAWYLYNNVSGTRKKISDMESAVDQANTTVTEAKASLQKNRNMAIALVIALVAAIAAIIVLFLNLRRARNEGGEIDLMSIRKKQEKERRQEEGNESRKGGLSLRRHSDAKASEEDTRREVRRIPASGSDRQGQTRQARDARSSADGRAYATRRPAESRSESGTASRPQRSDRDRMARGTADRTERETVRRDARSQEVRERRPVRSEEDSDVRTDRERVRRNPDRSADRAERSAVRTERSASEGTADTRRETARPSTDSRRAASREDAAPVRSSAPQNFANVDDDDEFQFIDVRNDD